MDNFSFAIRENNSKRKHIVVNTQQGRYIPVSAAVTNDTFRSHAKSIKHFLSDNQIPLKDVIVIGFAEAAVAIGAYVADELEAFYVSSTREDLPSGFETISFEETHSHATGHSLCIRDKSIFKKARCIILAEDEFTTGNTALALVHLLQEYISSDCVIVATAFIASTESRQLFADNNILCFAEHLLNDIEALRDLAIKPKSSNIVVSRKPDAELGFSFALDFRLGVLGKAYFESCMKLSRLLADHIKDIAPGAKTIDVIGTEECGVAPIVFGKELVNKGYVATTHSITRAPIAVADNNGYPLKSRVQLDSLYAENRTVYLYNSPSSCDVTVIITDAKYCDEAVIQKMCSAVAGKVIIAHLRSEHA